MVTFKDGPAQGQTLSLQRAPIFLRVVFKPKTDDLIDGDWDALDQLSDTPEENEEIWAYVITGAPSSCHLLFGGKERHRSGWYACAEYRLCENQPTYEVLRDTDKWREWTRGQPYPKELQATE